MTPLKYYVFENNMGNGALALLDAVLSVHSSSAVILPRKFTDLGFLERGSIYIKVWGFALLILSHIS